MLLFLEARIILNKVRKFLANYNFWFATFWIQTAFKIAAAMLNLIFESRKNGPFFPGGLVPSFHHYISKRAKEAQKTSFSLH